MIDSDHPLSVVRQAKLLQITRGAVYYRSRPTSEADLALMRRVPECFAACWLANVSS